MLHIAHRAQDVPIDRRLSRRCPLEGAEKCGRARDVLRLRRDWFGVSPETLRSRTSTAEDRWTSEELPRHRPDDVSASPDTDVLVS